MYGLACTNALALAMQVSANALPAGLRSRQIRPFRRSRNE